MVLWVFKVTSLASAVGQAGTARTQHPIADFYLAAVAQAVFEGAITKKMDLGLKMSVLQSCGILFCFCMIVLYIEVALNFICCQLQN